MKQRFYGAKAGVSGSKHWKHFSGKVKDLQFDQLVCKRGQTTGETFGFDGGLMDIKNLLSLPGGIEIVNLEEHVILLGDWT